jgi:hypothetical protein
MTPSARENQLCSHAAATSPILRIDRQYCPQDVALDALVEVLHLLLIDAPKPSLPAHPRPACFSAAPE